MNVLSIDIGGTGVKILATEETERRRFESGPTVMPQMSERIVDRSAIELFLNLIRQHFIK